MTHEIDTDKLATLLRERRGNQGLRAIAKEIGHLSASTLSRLEQGNVPDLDTFIRICRWLEVSPEFFILNKDQRFTETRMEPPMPEQIAVHLRADRTLDPETIDAIVKMIRLAYEASERSEANDKANP